MAKGRKPRTVREQAASDAAVLLKKLLQIRAQKRGLERMENEAFSELKAALETLVKPARGSGGENGPEIDAETE